jgi:hypothetical protein
MEPIISTYLSGLKLGEAQLFKNMGIVPLFTSLNGGPHYLSLKEALDKELITITEVDHSGSVPQLKVISRSDSSVLLLDGEELMGAKQNRVLNTSILLAGHSETIIPVSCKDQGRWGYTTRAFSDSELMMSSRARGAKSHSVTDSLHARRGYSSDQHRVWAEIEGLHQSTGTLSSTRALRDVYTTKTGQLEEYEQAFECLPNQKGCLVFINGKVVGFDVISSNSVYNTVHAKLIKSYALDGLLQSKEQFNQPSIASAQAFLQEIQDTQASKFDSVGQGLDYRFEGSGAVGSALVSDASVIHLTFFRLNQGEKEQPTPTPTRQRSWWQRIWR